MITRGSIFFRGLPYASALVFLGIPLAAAKDDMWDGSIIAYAMETRDFTGLRSWFFTSGWEKQYWLLRAEQWIADTTSLEFRWVNGLLLMSGMLLLVFETQSIAVRDLRLTRTWAVAAGTLVATFPAWHVLLSSVLTIHLLCISIGLTAVRLLRSSRLSGRLVGFVLMLLSFQLNSMLLFVPVLSYVGDLMRRWDSSKRLLPSATSATILAAAVCYYGVQRLLNAPTGVYEGYNELLLPFSSSAALTLLASFMRYATFLFIPSIGVLLLVVVSSLLSNSNRSLNTLTDNRVRTIAVIGLVTAAVVPYVFVGKSASLTSYMDWDGRQAFPLAPALSLFTVVVLHFTLERMPLARKKRRLAFGMVVAAILAAQAGLLVAGMGVKLNRQSFETDLKDQISQFAEDIPSGTVQVVVAGLPGPAFRDYESNYLLFRATGAANRWATITSDLGSTPQIPDWFESEGVPRAAYAFDQITGNCHTVIKAEARGYQGLRSARALLPGANTSQFTQIVHRYSYCIDSGRHVQVGQ